MRLLNSMLRVCLYSLLFIGPLNALPPFIEYVREDPSSDSSKAVNALMDEAGSILPKKYKMKIFGTQIAMPGGIVKKLGLNFHIIGPLSIKELRKILIDCSHDFQEMINSNLALKPFLEVSPFGIDRVEITLFLVDEKRREMQCPDIGIAEIRHGMLNYEYYKNFGRIPNLRKTVSETYERAVKILERHSKAAKINAAPVVTHEK